VARLYRERPSSRPTLTAVPGGAPGRSAPPLDGSQEFADLFGDVPEFELPDDQPPSLPEALSGESGSGETEEPPPEAAQVPPDEQETAEVASAEQLPLDTAPKPAAVYRLPSP